MRHMTYKRLMRLIKDGRAEVAAWTTTGEPALADVRFYDARGNSKREHVEVTHVPAELQR